MNLKKLFVALGLVVSVGAVNHPNGNVDAQITNDEMVRLVIADFLLYGTPRQNVLENIYLGLTNINPITREIEPELASRWTVSEEGRVWTFYLRDDVYWMQYDPVTGTAESLRLVNASDFIPRFTNMCFPTILGCTSFVDAEQLDPNQPVPAGTSLILAPDDFTLVFQLEYPSQAFLAYTTSQEFHPLFNDAPSSNRAKAGSIVTNGPFFWHEGDYNDDKLIFVRNKMLPEDLQGEGNVDVVEYRDKEGSRLDSVTYDIRAVSFDEYQRVLSNENLKQMLVEVETQGLIYLVFNRALPPFDNPLVRRAFSAIIDREALQEFLGNGLLVPTAQYTAPDIPFAPQDREIGVGFDPEYARAQLAAAGYPDCKGLPRVDFMGRGQEIYRFVIDNAVQYLGCDMGQFMVDIFGPPITNPEDPFAVSYQEFQARFHVWIEDFYGNDRYPDPKAYLFDFYCKKKRWQYDYQPLRACTTVDAALQVSEVKTDEQERIRAFEIAEEGLFGPEGEFPIAPLFYGVEAYLVQAWVSGPIETDGFGGGWHWDAYTVDTDTKPRLYH